MSDINTGLMLFYVFGALIFVGLAFLYFASKRTKR